MATSLSCFFLIMYFFLRKNWKQISPKATAAKAAKKHISENILKFVLFKNFWYEWT